ncbi:MAG: hypothetical protein FWC79_07765 [Oscillospiraceae bacterium]|nr:hypothetical protein [Oscillospiraceae bacterium]
MNIETRQSYSEVNRFLELVGEDLSNKIPLKLRNFFKREMDKTYIPTMTNEIPIKEQNLKRKTVSIIAGLNLQYWCKDEEEKKKLIREYSRNDTEHQNELREKYNPDNIFKPKLNQMIIEKTVEDAIIVQEEASVFKRIIEKIKKFLNLK